MKGVPLAAAIAPGELQPVVRQGRRRAWLRRRRRGVIIPEDTGALQQQVRCRAGACRVPLQACGGGCGAHSGGELRALPLDVGEDCVAQHGQAQQREQRVGEPQQRPAQAPVQQPRVTAQSATITAMALW